MNDRREIVKNTDTAMNRRLTVAISGREQGVFFRSSARIRAAELGITGFAKNEDDASLTVVAEGGESQLKAFLAWCRTGPLLARVDGVRIDWQDATGEFTDFRSQ